MQIKLPITYNGVVEQLIRPTGIVDPEVEIRPAKTQIPDLIEEIKQVYKEKGRVLVVALTKRMAEELTFYLKEQGFKVMYLHSDIKTLERSDILDKLRSGDYDILVGINLLREGLDLPEVTLVAILDADKEGFLRSKTSLIQTMGRAARNVRGRVILYADKVTDSIKAAVNEVNRRRKIQLEYNKKHGITPHTIKKSIREKISVVEVENKPVKRADIKPLIEAYPLLPKKKQNAIIRMLRQEMKQAADRLEFEIAAEIRDTIHKLQQLKA